MTKTTTYQLPQVKPAMIVRRRSEPPPNVRAQPLANGEIRQFLNDVYKQAVVTWNVTVEPRLEVSKISSKMSATQSSVISNYSSDMNTIISAYKKANKIENNVYYIFVIKEFEDSEVKGYMPMKRSYGFVSYSGNSENLGRAIAHELGHGAFRLRHIFAEYPAIRQSSSDNLMDYVIQSPDGTILGMSKLYKYQWDFVHNPEGGLYWFQDEEDIMLIGQGDNEAARQIVETLRFGYAFDQSVTISYSGNGLGTSKITLGDNIEYEEVLIALHQERPIKINPKAVVISEDFNVLNNPDALRFGFNHYRQTSNRGFYSVELETKTRNEQYKNLKKYVLCEDRESWLRNIDLLLSRGGHSLANLNALPDKALSEISNEQRITLLNRIINAKISGYYPLAVRVMENIPQNQANDLFLKISQSNIFQSLKSAMSNEVYANFVRASLQAYYRQEGVKEKLLNTSPEKIFVWHKGMRINGIGSDINYTLKITNNSLEIKGKVDVWVAHGPPGMQSPRFAGSVDLYNTTLNMTDLLAIQVDTDLGVIKAGNQVIPIPAFYFDWLVTNYNREQLLRLIDVSITLGSLAVGLGELRLVSAAGRFIFALKTTSIVKSTINLVMLNEEINRILIKSEEGEVFLNRWNVFCFVYDLLTFDLKNVSKNRNFFNDLSIAFNAYKIFLKEDVEDLLYRELETFMKEIEKEL